MLTEDLTIFTDPDGIGDTMTVSGADMDGIFSAGYVEVRGVEGYYPTHLVSNADAATVTKNSTVLVKDSTNYICVSKQPDGTGMTLLVLEEQ